MRRIRPLLFLYLVAMAAFAETSVAGLVIDDFERGSFYIEETGSSDEIIVSIGEPAHCIAPDRRVGAYSTVSGQVIASLNVGLEADDKVVADFINGGELFIGYDWTTPIDFTQGGRNDQVAVYLTEVVAGAGITMHMGGPSGIINRNVAPTEPGTYYFDISGPGGAASDVTFCYFSFNCNPDLEGRFIIADIRATYSPAHFGRFMGNFVATQTPPIPTPPLQFTLFDEVSQPLFVGTAGIDYADNLGAVPEMLFDWSETPFHDGEMAFMKMWWNENDAYDNAQFEFSFDFVSTGGTLPVIVYPPDPVIGAHGMSISTGLRLEDGGGNVFAKSVVDITFSTGRFQDVVFESVVITQNRVGHSEGHRRIAYGFDVLFTLAGTNVDMAEPLLEIAYVANVWPFTTSDAPTLPLDRHEVELSALPSVTRGTTVLRSNAPMEGDSRLEIFSPAGRKLRSWPLERGPVEVLWNGRDERGALVPAGIYWARLLGTRANSVTRIVRVR